ncbi:MAG: type II toxin-antitoxin system ParD family antitoxin [Rhodospirillaceae bacterium]|nr:type II toxin-antitoxin system ParD family antitoxin [Rhodospirillaceae bacterium]
MKVALDSHGDQIVSDLVAEGRFASADEAVRAALRLLEQNEHARRERMQELDQEIRAGLDSGPVEEHDMETLIDQLERRSAGEA